MMTRFIRWDGETLVIRLPVSVRLEGVRSIELAEDVEISTPNVLAVNASPLLMNCKAREGESLRDAAIRIVEEDRALLELEGHHHAPTPTQDESET